ncbi:MAG: FecR domain-containing protein [Balneolaceae bacterium]
MTKEKKINIALISILIIATSGMVAVEMAALQNGSLFEFVNGNIQDVVKNSQNPQTDSEKIVEINLSQSANDRPLALVTRLIPNLLVRNLERELNADKGSELFNGDTLRTDENGYALIVFMDRSTAKVRPKSQVIVRGEIDRDRNSSSRLNLNIGEMFLEIEKRPNNELEVSTTTTVASVKGTKFGARHTGYFWVEEGEVEVTAIESGETVTITSGMFARIGDDGIDLISGNLSDEEIAELGRDYRILDSELNEKRLILRFRDANGQLREEEVIYYEQNE